MTGVSPSSPVDGAALLQLDGLLDPSSEFVCFRSIAPPPSKSTRWLFLLQETLLCKIPRPGQLFVDTHLTEQLWRRQKLQQKRVGRQDPPVLLGEKASQIKNSAIKSSKEVLEQKCLWILFSPMWFWRKTREGSSIKQLDLNESPYSSYSGYHISKLYQHQLKEKQCAHTKVEVRNAGDMLLWKYSLTSPINNFLTDRCFTSSAFYLIPVL